ncbi:PilZ domain-containing protein [Oceanospirillum sp.]|uniref:PilZ domain-containing protein n=1 Tax=Oceanospirillum sp. TaxID=2021254 RepID=UPI003A944FBD
MEFFLPTGEKRAFPRTRLNLNCELRFSDAQSQLDGQCLDLSTTGAKVLFCQKITTGAQAFFRLKEHLGKEPFEARVEVTRVEYYQQDTREDQSHSHDTPRYCAGLKIVEIL